MKNLSALRIFSSPAPRSPYGPLHALAAGAVLLWAVLSKGVASFWHQFVYGLNQTMSPKVLMINLGAGLLLFGLLLLFLWISTLFRRKDGEQNHPKPNRLAAIRLAVCAAPVLFIVAAGMNWACGHLLEWLTGTRLADQELVKCLIGGDYPPGLRLLLFAVILFEAPLIEEPLFRGVVFRGLAKRGPVWMAMAASGFLFALVHVNAATFLPLWYLGAAFAWLYARTGTILAPMTAHFLFNATNLVLLLFFPELAAG